MNHLNVGRNLTVPGMNYSICVLQWKFQAWIGSYKAGYGSFLLNYGAFQVKIGVNLDKSL